MPLEIRGAHFLIRSAQLVRKTRLGKALPTGVINKPSTVELWISPVYQRLAVAKFSKSTMYKLLA